MFDVGGHRRSLDNVVYSELVRSRRLGSPLGFVVLSRHDNRQNRGPAEGHRRRVNRLANQVGAMVRRYDQVVVSRGTRESLVVVAPGCGPEQVERLAARLAQATTWSSGAAAYPSDGHQVADILARARERLGEPRPGRVTVAHPEASSKGAGTPLATEGRAAAQP